MAGKIIRENVNILKTYRTGFGFNVRSGNQAVGICENVKLIWKFQGLATLKKGKK